jgi:rubredoxin
MQKFYCEHCRLIYDEMRLCKKCGEAAEKQIWIEVQKQSNEK